MSNLIKLMTRLGSDAELAKAYATNPKKVMEDAKLSPEEMKLLEEADLKALEKATGLNSLKKITIIIRSPER
ncbi:hypothetical protein [Thiolapillus sp.]